MKGTFWSVLVITMSIAIAAWPSGESSAVSEKKCSLTTVVSEEEGNVISCEITVTNAPNEVSAFGLDMEIPEGLEFTGNYKAGALTAKFDQFGANQIDARTVRVGGFTVSNTIPEGASGTLASLEFRVRTSADGRLVLKDLVNDVKGWQGCDGKVKRHSK